MISEIARKLQDAICDRYPDWLSHEKTERDGDHEYLVWRIPTPRRGPNGTLTISTFDDEITISWETSHDHFGYLGEPVQEAIEAALALAERVQWGEEP